jgi:hypothetical protein
MAIRKRTEPRRIPMNTLRFVSLDTLFVLLSAIIWAPAALGSDAGIHSFSGDDAYDPAAGGTPQLSVGALTEWSVPATTARAAGEELAEPTPGVFLPFENYPNLPASAPEMETAESVASVILPFELDPAAGGTPEQSVVTLIPDVSWLVACSPSAGEAIAQNAWATSGGFSGDDDYDPAAGGAPELSLLAFVADASLALACESVAPNN